MEKSNAYVTLLSTEDYLDGVRVLKKSLEHTESQYPFICAVTEDIYKRALVASLEGQGIIVKKIQRLEYSLETQKKWKGMSVLNTASKISLFNLKEWNKLCYIDADSIILKNIDNIFNYPDGSMLWSPYEESGNEYNGITSLMVFSPKNHNAELYYSSLINTNHFDGDFFENLWFHIKENSDYRIPYKYHSLYMDVLTNYIGDVKGIHFCNEWKPWLHYKELSGNWILRKYRKYMDEIKENR